MAVRRVVTNIAASDIEAALGFYRDVLGMTVAMDLGWIITFAGATGAPCQLSVAAEGGSGTPVPDFSIEVDDFAETLQRAMAAGLAIEYGPVRESWGVTRFHVRDPYGRLINILTHT